MLEMRPSGEPGGTELGRVAGLWQYPVKSMQGIALDSVTFDAAGVVGDRAWGLVDRTTGHLMSAKRYRHLLAATTDGDTITLPDGTTVGCDDPDVHRRLSDWLGREVELRRPGGTLSYEMTFEPPNDDAEYFEIPAPPDSFRDLAGAHLISRATLEAGAQARPDLNWDVRRFRPNLLVEAAAGAFAEDTWCGRHVHIGDAVLVATQPTVRCAMPLRAQPAIADRPALETEPELFGAMDELHANHFGIYLNVVTPGTVRIGDPVTLGDPVG